jgi:prepilin-type processing-associated H-X9-DG protein
LSTFLCPSDGPPLAEWPGGNNYVANQQTWACDLSDSNPSVVAPTEVNRGIFYFGSAVRLASVTDGLSNTAFFSEKLKGQGTPNFRSDNIVIPPQTSLDATFGACRSIAPTSAVPLTSRQGMSWVMGEMCCTTYNHVAVPNTLTCAGLGFQGTMANMAMQVPPSSLHPGGVNVLMGDGSVKFVKSTIGLDNWRALGTRNGGEVISADY